MRRSQRRRVDFELFRAFAFGSDEDLIAAFGSMERAAEVWSSVRAEFLDRWNLWGMPEAWWKFEAEVPDELRRGPHAILDVADAREWTRIDRSRRAYLASRGIDPVRRRRAQR